MHSGYAGKPSRLRRRRLLRLLAALPTLAALGIAVLAVAPLAKLPLAVEDAALCVHGVCWEGEYSQRVGVIVQADR